MVELRLGWGSELWPAPVAGALEALVARLEAILRDEGTATSRAHFAPPRQLIAEQPDPVRTGSTIGGYPIGY